MAPGEIVSWRRPSGSVTRGPDDARWRVAGLLPLLDRYRRELPRLESRVRWLKACGRLEESETWETDVRYCRAALAEIPRCLRDLDENGWIVPPDRHSADEESLRRRRLASGADGSVT